MAFFGLAAVNDLQPEKKAESTLSKFKDLLFSVFAFPVGTFVVLLFWAIFAYDRELVYPATIDTFFPPWMNHAMHTFVLPILLGEVLVQPHVYPQTKHALTALGIVGLAYLSCWVNVCMSQTFFFLPFFLFYILNMFCRIIWVYMSVGIWVYPLLGRFSAAGLVGFFFFNMSVVILLYLLGNELSRRVWEKDMNKKTRETNELNLSPTWPHGSF
ncbi:androgen-dependent TFPI-regulating protein [Pundamilia nyererei]|uniref:Androgen-dependent TFPI-regulating protein n=1 Tax=Pundamilia nyererei TaxID=303518 RepID=A0A9Y3RM90_9CICH|nr:PREDICTED: androgen-dependent TFPI-regulating protein-like [Pundamilia nyererei]